MAKKFVTVKDVELARVGTWNASTGQQPLTLEMFEQAVEAHNSGELSLPVIKIGHVDPRFENPDWDGEPAYGQIDNLRVSDERGGTLLGDYVNMPEELAEILASAYPERSVELDFDLELLDTEGEVTTSYGTVLTGLALLGAAAPAVKGLASVHAKFSATAAGHKVKRTKSSRIKASAMFTAPARFAFNGQHTADSLRRELQKSMAQLSTGDEWVDAWVEDFDDTTVWHYFNGEIVQRSYTVQPDGAVVLSGDFVKVVEKRVFEPVSDTAPVPQAETTEPQSAGVAASAASTTDEGDAEMAFTESQLTVLRKQFGLDDAATLEEVMAAIDAADTQEEAPADVASAEAPVVQEPAAAPVAASEPTPSVQLSAASFAAMQKENESLRAEFTAMKAERDKERRDKAIFSALKAGKLHPSEKDAWRKAMDENEESVTALLSARHAAFPTQELGSDAANFSLKTNETVEAARLAADDEFFGGSH